MTDRIREILERVERDGKRLSSRDAVLLYRDASLEDLSRAAFAARCRMLPGDTVTYLIDRNINYTNVCVTDCQFCAFYRPSEDHPEAYVNSRAIIGKKIEETIAIGGTRILMQGGHHPKLRLSWYEDLVRWIHETYPSIQIDAFSPSEIQHIAELERVPLREVLRRLSQCGLRGLPGGGAEILDDEVRQRVSPKKQRAGEWLEVMRIAQELGLATTATMVIGFGETIEQRIGHLERLRLLSDESLARHGNGFIAFIAWTLQIENTSLGASRSRPTYGADAPEYLRHTAIARLYLDNIPHLQASWPTMGEETARKALHAGADDFGSTMLEENVVSAAGTGRFRMSEEAIQAEIRKAGFRPAQRDTRYRILKTV